MNQVMIDLRKIEHFYICDKYRDKDFITLEEILNDYDESLSKIEDMEDQIKELKDEYEELEQDIEDNYKRITKREMYE